MTICGQTGGRYVDIVLDVPRPRPSASKPRPPKTPREKKARVEPPRFFLEEWREFAGYSFREFADLTGIDGASLNRAENRAAGRDVKNKHKGVDIGVLSAYADALGLATIESLRRLPTDPPTDVEQFVTAPADWRADFVSMLNKIGKT